MEWYYIVLIFLISLLAIVLITSYVCYRLTFYHKPKKIGPYDLEYPSDNFFEPYTQDIIDAMNEAIKMEHQRFTIKSFDNLTLHGRYYEYEKNAPIEILFHGYKGNGLRDLSIGIKRCFKAKHSVLLVDQRAHGLSEGHVTSFGINEHKDCLEWINFTIEHFGKDVKIILSGVSLGAATVLLASSLDLPENVIGILADCGFDSAKNIIKKCVKEMHLSPTFFYPFIKLGAKIFGKFNLDETSPIKAMEKCKIPVIFLHGDKDFFVPCDMSINMYNKCQSTKKLVLIPNASHGIAYLVEPELYLNEVINFFNK